MDKKNILLIGCGKMGSALLNGWLEADLGFECTIVAPNKPDIQIEHPTTKKDTDTPHPIPERDALEFNYIKSIEGVNKDFLTQADVAVLAVKPQIMDEVCESLKSHLSTNTLILSIAAGQSIANIGKPFASDQPIIRSMPNTPAAIGQGITVAVANEHCTEAQKALAQTLLECVSIFEWIDDESLMDSVTALSGSGPAYVFYLIEVLARAGEKIGLDADMAEKLARQTVIGSAALAAHHPDKTAAALREQVTSPNGTTAAALEVLMNGEMQKIFDQALAAAQKRGDELNS